MNYRIEVSVKNGYFNTNIHTDAFSSDDPIEDIINIFFAYGAEFKGTVSIFDRFGNDMMIAGFGRE